MATSHQQYTDRHPVQHYPSTRPISTPKGAPPNRLPPLSHQGNLPPVTRGGQAILPATQGMGMQQQQDLPNDTHMTTPDGESSPQVQKEGVPQINVSDNRVDSGLIPPPAVYSPESMHTRSATEQRGEKMPAGPPVDSLYNGS